MTKNSNNTEHGFGKITLTVLFVFLMTSAAQAQGNGPGFHVSTRFDNGCTASQTLSSPTPPASIGPVTVPCVSGSGTAAAEAGAGTLRASAHAAHFCCGSASSVNGRSRIQIENVVITGPAAASIPISLNLHLRGTINSHTDFGQAGITLFLALHGFNTLMMSTSEIYMSPFGILNQTGVFAPMNVTFPNATIDQMFSTPTVNAAPNQPLTLEFQMSVFSDMAGLGATQSDFFSDANGLRLPFGTPVFNLPPGYTVNIPELNIINNFVALPAVVSGDIFIVGTNASEISLAGVTEVTGNVTIDGNTAATGIDTSSLQSVRGNFSIDGNTSATGIDNNLLQNVGGNLSIDGNTSATGIDNNLLQNVGGNLSIDGNTSATGIDNNLLQSVGGDLNITQNGPCTNVILGTLTTVNGNLTIDSCGTGIFTPGHVAAGGDTTLKTKGYTVVNGTTAAGKTTLSNTTSEASMTVQVPAGSFTTPVSFSLTHLDPATLAPEPGLDANNALAIIDPLATYQITFGVPTLNRDATLIFDVFLNNLDTDNANALLGALANGTATLATRGDGAGSQYQAFPICGPGHQPTAGGCVLVQLLDANGQPTTGTPAIVRFSNVVGHFSTWAVAIVTPQSSPSHFFNGLLSPYPAPPHTTMPTFKRGRVVPLKFNWVNAAGVVVDSANANPTVTFAPTNCTTQAALSDPIVAEDAGNSGGLRYDASTLTWTFNWTTKPLAAGCFVISVTLSNAAYAAPPSTFPVALRDR